MLKCRKIYQEKYENLASSNLCLDGNHNTQVQIYFIVKLEMKYEFNCLSYVFDYLINEYVIYTLSSKFITIYDKLGVIIL